MQQHKTKRENRKMGTFMCLRKFDKGGQIHALSLVDFRGPQSTELTFPVASLRYPPPTHTA